MSDTEPDFKATDGAGIEDLRSQVLSLQGTLSLTLVLMFIFTVCVNIFLFRQASMAGAEATGAENLVNNYVNGGENQARDIFLKLSAYGSTHPDFAPIMNKWSSVITIHTNAPAAMPKK